MSRKFDIWNAVKVSNPDHERHGDAGIVHATAPQHPEEVGVKFDKDGVVVVMKDSDLESV